MSEHFKTHSDPSSNMSPESRLFQTLAGEIADDIYVVNKGNYHLLYANDLKSSCCKGSCKIGQKCYQILYGKSEPCEFCMMNQPDTSDDPDETVFEENGRFFTAKAREMDWNGIPAHVRIVRDVTEEVLSRKQKERLEQYFQTVVKYLPGGMAVVHHEIGGALKPEYLSDGFSEMLDMSKEDAWDMYEKNALSGVHPDDRDYVRKNLDQCIRENREKYELQYRLKKGNGDYIWVNAKFSVIQCDGGDARVYADYHDITAEKKMQEQLRQQYKEQILQHYLSAGSDALILGHCNITQNTIYEIVDYTDSNLLETFGEDREDFFIGLGTLIEDEQERSVFYSKYLKEPSLQAYYNDTKELIISCFIRLPNQKAGKYVQFKVILVETPDTGDITGILTVTDITEKKIREKIFLQLSSTNYDLVANVNLLTDTYEIVSGGDDTISEQKGSNSDRVRKILETMVVDNEQEKQFVADMLDSSLILKRLKDRNSYSFTYSVCNANGELRTKNLIVSAIVMRLGRVCLIRSDVTDVVIAERTAKESLEKALAEAKKANRVKSDFLSSMSHDIRTPMNAIVGLTTLALSNLDNPEKIKEVLVQKNDISSNGIGLQYVARMLENRFGNDFELKAERTEDGVNVVEIRIPFEADEISGKPDKSERGYP